MGSVGLLGRGASPLWVKITFRRSHNNSSPFISHRRHSDFELSVRESALWSCTKRLLTWYLTNSSWAFHQIYKFDAGRRHIIILFGLKFDEVTAAIFFLGGGAGFWTRCIILRSNYGWFTAWRNVANCEYTCYDFSNFNLPLSLVFRWSL